MSERKEDSIKLVRDLDFAREQYFDQVREAEAQHLEERAKKLAMFERESRERSGIELATGIKTQGPTETSADPWRFCQKVFSMGLLPGAFFGGSGAFFATGDIRGGVIFLAVGLALSFVALRAVRGDIQKGEKP